MRSVQDLFSLVVLFHPAPSALIVEFGGCRNCSVQKLLSWVIYTLNLERIGILLSPIDYHSCHGDLHSHLDYHRYPASRCNTHTRITIGVMPPGPTLTPGLPSTSCLSVQHSHPDYHRHHASRQCSTFGHKYSAVRLVTNTVQCVWSQIQCNHNTCFWCNTHSRITIDILPPGATLTPGLPSTSGLSVQH